LITLAMNLGANPQVTQPLGTSTLRVRELIHGTTVYVKLPSVAPAPSGRLASSG